MIELFEQDIKTNDRQSSKGNQLKWNNKNKWYKADYAGYEGLSEYVISKLLLYSNLTTDEFVEYNPVEITFDGNIYLGSESENFLKEDWQIITLERLFLNYNGKGLNKCIWSINEPSNRLTYLVNSIERFTGIKNFGVYMNKVLTIDAFFLNDDRHTHNLALLMNSQGEFKLCPIFDNGAGLLADTTIDYHMGKDIFELIGKVRSKTFSTDLNEQLDVSESLYGCNLKFTFTKKDVEQILGFNDPNSKACIYSIEIRSRVRDIIFEQMRKYPYLFVDKKEKSD